MGNRDLERPMKPPEEFEAQYGLQCIAGHYQFPDIPGLDRESLLQKLYKIGPRIFSDGIEKSEMQGISAALTEISKLNPSIQAIPYDKSNDNDSYDVLHGVVSGINVADITYYLLRRRASESNAQFPKERIRLEQERKICEQIGHDSEALDWVASPETLEAIQRQIKGRDFPSSASRVNRRQ